MNRTETVHLVVNRRARNLGDDAPVYGALLDSVVSPTVLHETRSLAELDAVARSIAETGGDVVLAGGDGSYMAGITALARAFGPAPLPRVALAPGGTVATVARNWGMKGNLRLYAHRLLDAVQRGVAEVTERPTLRIVDARGGERIGFIFGTGLVSQFFDLYYAAPRQGYGGAARIVARIFAGSFTGGALASKVLTPVPCSLTVDGEEQPSKAYSLIAASVVRDLGLHMQLLHRAAEDPSRVHLVASSLGARGLGPQMPLVLAGRRLLGKHHVDRLARSFRVTFAGDHEAYVLDGDVLRAPWVEVSAGPTLRVLTPPGALPDSARRKDGQEFRRPLRY
jgi:diacylglycerol kinase (ATP)